MSQPLPPQIILPGGQPAYLNPYKGTYTTSRRYAQAMQRAYARGEAQSAARGHRIPTEGPYAGMSESRRRAAIAVENGDELSPWQRFTFEFERRWGFSYTYWRKLKRLYINQLNSMLSPSSQITPALIASELQNEQLYRSMGYEAGRQWVEDQLQDKLDAVTMDRANMPKETIRNVFRHPVDDFRPREWWWYHR